MSLQIAVRLAVLCFGNLIIGTGSSLVTGLVVALSEDFHVTPGVAGQLITAFGLTICLVGPPLGALTSRFDRRKLLVVSLALFAAGHGLSALAPGYWSLMAARILTAASGAVYTSQAAMTASLLVPQTQRGKAMAFVFLGISLAAVVGMPMGSYLGHVFGWRYAMGALAIIALAGACLVAYVIPSRLFIAPLRLSVWKDIWSHPTLIGVISVSAFQYAGQATVLSYLVVALRDAIHAEALATSLFFALFGLCGVTGNLLGARLIDRVGAARIVALSIGLMITALAGWGLVWGNTFATVAALVLWGLGGFIVNGATQVRIVELAPLLAPVAVALNSSFTYLGQSSGSAMGGLILDMSSSRWLPAVGALMLTVALLVSLRTQQRIRGLPPTTHP